MTRAVYQVRRPERRDRATLDNSMKLDRPTRVLLVDDDLARQLSPIEA
jgi:hypothetical protein